MKIVVAIVITAVVTFAGAFFLVSHIKEAQFGHEKSARQEDSRSLPGGTTNLAGTPAGAETASVKVATTNKVIGPQALARQCLSKLTKLKPSQGPARNSVIRQIVHQFESLVDLGYDGLPAIKEFLNRFEEVDYSAESARPPELSGSGATSGLLPAWARGRGRVDSILPPSLRLGLVDVLKTIGGPEAQAILANILSTTGRGVEVAYTARALQEMAPDQYRDLALTVARDLLNNPPKIDHPNRLDQNSKGYLLEVLAMYDDHSYTGHSQAQLVTLEGQLDRTALDYLSKSLKEQAMPVVYQAYRDQRLSNVWERAALVNVALNYVGFNPEANSMFADVVTNTSLPTAMRTMAIQNVLGSGRTKGQSESDAQTGTQNLLTLLNSIRSSVGDDQVAHTLEEGIEALNQQLSGNSTNAPPAPTDAEP